MSRIRLKFSGQSDALEADVQVISSNHFKITLHEKEHQIILDKMTNDSGYFEFEGKMHPFYFLRQNEEFILWIAGKTFQFNVSKKEANEARSSPSMESESMLRAPMPGKVLKIDGAPGSRVEKNHPILVMESMKMEMSVSSPVPARIQKIFCKAGDLVELGQALVKLEPLE